MEGGKGGSNEMLASGGRTLGILNGGVGNGNDGKGGNVTTFKS